MVDRSVTVRLKIDNSDFIRGLAQSAAAAKAFERSLGGGTEKFGSSLSDTGDEAEDFSEHLHTATAESKAFEKSTTQAAAATSRQGAAFRKSTNDQKGFLAALNSSNDRMSFLVQTSLALGPALIPAVAAAVPLVTGLGAALGFAAAASATAVIAFQGIGDALGALNDAQLEQSEANLAKFKLAMEELGPAGREFVVFLNGLGPELEKLQGAAQRGLFPGLTEGIEQVMTQAPLLRQVFESLGDVAGDIAAGTGGALTSPFWTDFFEFLRDDARTILTDFASGLGHVIEGISALFMAFQPLSEDFIGGFDDMAQSFSGWAQGLDETQGFQDFVQFVREAGPEFMDVLGALGDAIVELGKAGAGIGLASLEVLQRVLEGLSAVLSSPIGPPLLAFAAALSAVSRAIALYKVVAGNALVGGLTGIVGMASSGNMTKATSNLTKFNAAVSKMGVTQWSQAAGGVALLATSFTDLDENMGLTNTATFGALGAFLGPWGAAVGVVAGGLKDMAAANNEAQESIENIHTVLQQAPDDWAAQDAAIASAQASVESFSEDMSSIGFSPIANLPELKNVFEGLVGDSDVQELEQDVDVAIAAVQELRDAQAGLANAFVGRDMFQGSLADLPEITEQWERMAPAIDQVGTSQEELMHLATSGSPFDAAVLEIYLTQLRLITSNADTVAGRSQAVADAFAEIGDSGRSAAAGADALGAALSALFDPGINAQRAADAFAESLDHLEENAAKGSKALEGQTDAARQNRELFAASTDLLKDDLVARAALGQGTNRLTNAMQRQRQALIDEAEAVGFNRDEVKDLLKTYNLTPKLIRTIIENNAPTAKEAAKNLVEEYNKLPKRVRTEIAALGADATREDIRKLAKEYDLTPKQVRTIIEAEDNASVKIDGVNAKMKDLDGDEAEVSVNALTSAAQGALSSVLGLLNSIDGFSASATVSTTYQSVGRPPSQFGQPEPRASGGWIMGRGTATSDSIPAWLSDGEFVVNAKAAARFANTLQFINAQKFATGGQPGPRSPRQLAQRAFHLDDPTTLEQLAKALREVRQEAEDVTEAEQDLRAAREAAKESNKQVKDTEKDLEKARNEAGDKVSDEEQARIKKLEQRLRAQEKAQRAADKDQADAEKELSRQREQLAEATDRWREKQQELIDQAAAVQTAVAAAGAIFGGEGTSVTVGGMLSKLREAAKDAKRFNRNIAELRAVGLDERLVQQLLEAAGTPEGYQAAENLADASRQQIKRLNAAQGDLSRVSRASGQLGVETPGVGGVSVRATFTGPITTTDVTKLDQKLARRINRLVRMAKR